MRLYDKQYKTAWICSRSLFLVFCRFLLGLLTIVIGLLSNVPITGLGPVEPDDSPAADMMVIMACTEAFAFRAGVSEICKAFPQALPMNAASPLGNPKSIGSSKYRLLVVCQLDRTSGARASSVIDMLITGADCRVLLFLVHHVRPCKTATGGGQMNLTR